MGIKDKAKLVKKVITNKRGHKQTVWVKPGGLSTTMISGNSGRTVTNLKNKEYKLTKEIKDVKSGNNINIVLPKGTIIKNRPGGVYAIPPTPEVAKEWKDKYVSRSHYAERARFDEYGLMITKKPGTLQAIVNNSKAEKNAKGGDEKEKIKETAVWTSPKNGKSYDIQKNGNRWEMDIIKPNSSIYDKIVTIKRTSPTELKDWLDGYKIDSEWMEHLLHIKE